MFNLTQQRKSGLWTPSQKPPLQSKIDWQHPIVQPADGETTPSLVGCWLMNEDGGPQLVNLAKYNFETLVGMKWGSSGLENTVISTTNQVNVLNSDQYNMGTESFSFFVRCMQYTSGATHTGFIRKHDQNGLYGDNRVGWGCGVESGDDNLEARIGIGDGVNWATIKIGGGYAWGQFHTALFVCDRVADLLLIYIDGSFVGSVSCASVGNIDTIQGMILAKDYRTFIGLIDVEYLWKGRAITADEATLLHSDPYCFIEPLWPHRGALWEAVAVGGIVPLLAGMGNNMGSSANLMTG